LGVSILQIQHSFISAFQVIFQRIISNFGYMRVAILGAGHIANKMARTLKMLKESDKGSYNDLCYCIASRDLTKSEALASDYGFEKAYGSYEDMLADPLVDLVYVATPHALHYAHVRRCLESGKNVLCEKSFTTTAKEARKLIEIAEDKGLLLAEAAWSRYTPFWAKIKELLDSGAIGKPQSLSVAMGYPIKDVPRIIRPELGGGALLDLGVYTLHFARGMFGGEIEKMHSVFQMSETGVDLQHSITLLYKDGKMAQLHSTVLAVNKQTAIINGETGCMIVDNFSNPRGAKIYNGKHELIAEYEAEKQLTGFEYEVLACKRCIERKQTEVPELPHKEMIAVMEMMDSLRKDWGVKYTADDMDLS